ncbi:nitroreductase family protein [Butyrivibrio sp. NC3005]|uniref:nitroreductase family protein n=1 Tax=Butyrivibrio sp. NC3005 TaxID=1280685 RepID=UPI0003FEBB26|nr:nitroreductase family protein [Butyrivibrio sp. NC3005]
MNEVEAIKKRHSVRNYKPDKIEPDKIAQLKAKIDELNKDGNLHLQLIENAGNTYNKLLNRFMGLSTAPSVIACVGKDSETLEERVGYYGEKLVIFAQTLGLNTCWAGTFNRKNIGADIREGEKLVISIAIGYGQNQGTMHKSKDVSTISQAPKNSPDWFNKGVELALLAPTALNQQKFLIKLNDDETVDFIDKKGPFSKVDMGIVKCHFEIGASL